MIASQSIAENMASRKLYSLLLPFLIMVYMGKINAQTSDDAKTLLKKFINTDAYNKAVRPNFDQSQTTNVTMNFHLTGIIDFDSQKEILTTSGYLDIFWDDSYLTWNTLDYNSTECIFIPQDNVWKPDIALLNGVSKLKGLGSSNIFVKVCSGGNVNWYPFEIWKSTCNVDITYFPFDIQTCDLRFGTWTYLTTDVLITVGNDTIDLSYYETNSQWSIVDTCAYTEDIIGSPSAVFKINLKRKPLFFLLNVILPVIMLSLLNVCIFVLPAGSGEKASFSVTVFLALAIFLSFVMATLPQNSEQISFLGVYLVIMTALSTLAVILTMFQIRLNFRDVDVDLIPSWLIKLRVIVEVVRCRRCNKVHPATHSQNEVSVFDFDHTNDTENTTSETTKSKTPTANEQPKVTWKQISSSLDFVFFWIFSIATVSTTMTIFAIYMLDNRVSFYKFGDIKNSSLSSV